MSPLSRAVSDQTLVEKLTQKRSLSEKKLFRNEIIRSFCLFVGFMFVVFLHLKILDSRTLNAAALSVINKPIDISNLDKLDSAYDWLYTIAFTYIYAVDYYPKTSIDVPVLGVSRLATPFRLTQRRVKLKENDFQLIYKSTEERTFSTLVWEDSDGINSVLSSSPSYESKDEYGTFTYEEEKSVGRNGGFVQFARPKVDYSSYRTTLEETSSSANDPFAEYTNPSTVAWTSVENCKAAEEKAKTASSEDSDQTVGQREKLASLALDFQLQLCRIRYGGDVNAGNAAWIDEQSTVMGVDFALYNSNLDVFVYVLVEWERHFSGRVSSSFEISYTPVALYTQALDYFRASMEVILLVLIVISWKGQIQDLKFNYEKVLQNDDIFHDLDAKGKKRRKIILLFKSFGGYITDFFNLTELAFSTLSMVTCILYLVIFFDPGRIGFVVEDHQEYLDVNYADMNTLFNLANTLRTYRRVSSLVLLFGGFKTVKYFQELLPESYTIVNTFSRAKLDLLASLVLFFSLWLGFTITIWISFGNLELRLGTILKCMKGAAIFYFGDIQDAEGFANRNTALAATFILGFTVVVSWILTSLFIAALIYYYRLARAVFEQEMSKKEIPAFERNWQATVEDKLAFVRWKIQDTFFYLKKEENKKKYLRHIQEGLEAEESHDKNDYGIHYNLEFYTKDATNVSLDNFFRVTSSDREKRLMRSRELDRLRRYIWDGLFFVSLYVLYFGMSVWMLDISTRFAIYRAIHPGDTILGVETLQGLTTTFVQAPGTYWQENEENNAFTYLTFNILTTDTWRMTMRRGDSFDLRNNEYSGLEDRCKYNWSIKADDPWDDEFEHTSPWHYGDQTVSFSSSGGYENSGGYIVELPLEVEDYNRNLKELRQAGMFDFYLNSVVLDAFVFNSALNFFLYFAIVFEVTISGEVEPSVDVRSIYENPYALSSGTLLIVSQLLFLAMLFMYGYNVIRYFYSAISDYNSWARIALRSLTINQWTKRHRRRPEWQRKLTLFLSFERMLDIIVLVMCTTLLALWASILIELSEMSDNPTEGDVGILMEVTKILQHFRNLVGIVALILTLKALGYTRISRNINNLKRVFQNSGRTLLAVLLVVAGVFCGSALFARIIFGWFDKDWQDFDLIILKLWNMGIGKFDYDSMERSDEIYAPIFFFVFMFLFYIIIVNIVLPILFREYIREKKRQKMPGATENAITFTEAICTLLSNKKATKESSSIEEHLYETEIRKEKALALLKPLGTTLDARTGVMDWARTQASTIDADLKLLRSNTEALIIVDHQFRRNSLDTENILRLSQHKLTFRIKSPYYAIRAQAWDFDRLAYQLYNTQCQALSELRIQNEEALEKAAQIYHGLSTEERTVMVREVEALEKRIKRQKVILDRLGKLRRLASQGKNAVLRSVSKSLKARVFTD
eukprot:CAMPEP_0115006688 /NCGR_PEP_ID=MMETSP0216-20121206/20664_1 /TAXON_ID=223996 /ORGANISM="Protocruzia adherens, Strain Boccale" /LENGTH=1420 /DNA_ID=CAMNT_0002373349 /DNA_START=48 /DNA_END=4310 /DNA_ORIENTATION=+